RGPNGHYGQPDDPFRDSKGPCDVTGRFHDQFCPQDQAHQAKKDIDQRLRSSKIFDVHLTFKGIVFHQTQVVHHKDYEEKNQANTFSPGNYGGLGPIEEDIIGHGEHDQGGKQIEGDFDPSGIGFYAQGANYGGQSQNGQDIENIAADDIAHCKVGAIVS